MKIRIKCLNLGSESAKFLATYLTLKLGYKVWRSKKIKVKAAENLIYGAPLDKLGQYRYFAENKLNFPFFSESKEVAKKFKYPIVCRTLLNASQGKGIVIADSEDQLVDAPVYVEYKKKTNEYRVNIFRGVVVSVREKRLKEGYEKLEGRDGRIRNHNNGYVFCVPIDPVPPEVIATAIAASKCVASDFAGVDIAYHKPTNYHFLIEVNSAPGMAGLTVQEYGDEIIRQLNG